MRAYIDKDGNVTFDVYGRAALSTRYRDGKRIEFGSSPINRPLTVGSGHNEKEVYTLQFKLQLKIPQNALEPAGVPTFNVSIPEEALTGLAPEAEIVAVLVEEP